MYGIFNLLLKLSLCNHNFSLLTGIKNFKLEQGNNNYLSFVFLLVLCATVVIIILVFFIIRGKKIRNKLELAEEELRKQINESARDNSFSKSIKGNEDIISKQTIDLERHRQQLEKIVETRTNELKIAKDKAEESDRLKSSFLENMSHEIRTPMNAIVGFANLLEDFGLNQDIRKRYISRINANCQILLRLIEDILDMSKIQAGQMEIVKHEFPVNDVLESLYNDFNTEKEELNLEHIQFKLEINEQDKAKNYKIFSDPFRFKQILTKLLSNALKYTEKGEISIGFKPVFLSEFEKEPSTLQFFVKDTGIGIPNTKTEFIFDRFSKIEDNNSKLYRGAGLGLYISKRLISLMGGEIWVQSQLGSGSAFFFTLPYFDTSDLKIKRTARQKESSPHKTIQRYNWQGKTILIAEDEQNNYIYLSELIKRTGARVIEAKTGIQAVDIIKNIKEIDLVLMDILMPEMDGYTATKQIKAIRPSLPVIAQTAYALVEQKKKSIDAGCEGYISKPYDPPRLLDLINKFII